MRYLRVYLGAVRDEPGITLYEIDGQGWVHRMVEVQAHGARFAPEDILMLATVDPRSMAQHPAAEPFEGDAFEDLWREVRDERGFATQVPDPTLPWEGRVDLAGSLAVLRWVPDGATPAGWTRVRGFDRLFARGAAGCAERVYRAAFLGAPVRWDLLARAA